MNNFSLPDLIFIGFIIYAFFQMLKKGQKKGQGSGKRPEVQSNQGTPSVMDFFNSALDEIKAEAARKEEAPQQSTPEELQEKPRRYEPVYTEQMAEPQALIADRVRRRHDQKKKPLNKPEVEPDFEYLNPGELVITTDDSPQTKPIHEKLFDSLGDPHNLQHAVLLREVLDPPVSKRKRPQNRL